MVLENQRTDFNFWWNDNVVLWREDTEETEKTEKTEAFTVKKLAEWISIKKIAVAVGFAFFASMVPNWLLAFIARPSGDDYGYSAASHQTWLHTHSVIEVLRTGL